jgi:pimeloyl-ACP methyl ester carboxylesterase
VAHRPTDHPYPKWVRLLQREGLSREVERLAGVEERLSRLVITRETVDGVLGDAGPEETAGLRFGQAIHYVRGGRGPALVHVHGFPQDWYEWRRVTPRLSQHFTVIAVDLPGVGGSAPSAAGYAAADLAESVHLLIGRLGLGPAHVAGHDVGGWVAYALARRFPGSVRTVMILETPVPGIEQWLDLNIDVPLAPPGGRQPLPSRCGHVAAGGQG